MDLGSDPHDFQALVRDTLAIVLERPIGPREAVRRDDEATWDSLKHIELVFALEGALGVRFDVDDIAELNDVDSIVDIARKCAAA